MKKITFICLMCAFMLSGCGDGEISPHSNYSSEESSISTIAEDEPSAAPATKPYSEEETTSAVENATEKVTEAVSAEPETDAFTEEITEASTVPGEPPKDGQLVRILDYIPDAVIDLRYATSDNFTGVVLYDDPEAYLCYGTVKKLIKVQEELRAKDYRLLIWDAYRPPEAQWRLWEAYPDPTFVADPRKGFTSHSRGDTIDITIADAGGNPIEMPSLFDDFSAAADRNYSDASETAADNAKMLEEIMYNNGFTGYRGEWWDYSDVNRYTLIPYDKN